MRPANKAFVAKRLIFDLETDQFTDDFRWAAVQRDRIKHAPKMRIACVLDSSTGKYGYYGPNATDRLIARLLAAEEIVSFNGKNFDLLVLRRHYRLSKGDADRLNKKHIDLCQECEGLLGWRCSLDKLSRLNLGEQKQTSGRKMAMLNLAALKSACRSDVSQTYRIFQCWLSGSLILPSRRYYSRSDADIPLVHHHLADPFPFKYVDQSCDDMTDGQMSDYLAGMWGVLDDEDLTLMQV